MTEPPCFPPQIDHRVAHSAKSAVNVPDRHLFATNGLFGITPEVIPNFPFVAIGRASGTVCVFTAPDPTRRERMRGIGVLDVGAEVVFAGFLMMGFTAGLFEAEL